MASADKELIPWLLTCALDVWLVHRSNGMQCGGRRGVPDTLSHFQPTVEEHTVFHRQHRCLHAPVEHGGSPQLHSLLRSDVARYFSFTDNRACRHFGLDHRFISNQQHAIGVDFAIELPVDPHGPTVGDGSLELDAFSNKGDDVTNPVIGWSRCFRHLGFAFAVLLGFLFILPPHERPPLIFRSDSLNATLSLCRYYVRTNKLPPVGRFGNKYAFYLPGQLRGYVEGNY